MTGEKNANSTMVLRPCPSCGDPNPFVNPKIVNGETVWKIKCYECHASPFIDHSMTFVTCRLFPTMRDAMIAWQQMAILAERSQ